MSKPLRVGILTVSDRASAGVYQDLSGPAIQACLETALESPMDCEIRLVPDERERIEAALKELCDVQGCHLVLSTGGTGPAPRDVTPEATLAVCERELPGFGEAMRAASRERVPTAILSRQTAGTRGGALILNLPGKPKAVKECLEAVLAAIPDCVQLLGGPRVELRGGREGRELHPHDEG